MATITKNVVYQEALLTVPRDNAMPPPSPVRQRSRRDYDQPDAPGDCDDVEYSVRWNWATTNARGLMTACIAHAVGDIDAMAMYDVPLNAVYQTRLGSICVAHIIEDIRDTMGRRGRLSWPHISTPGGYVPAQKQNHHFNYTAAWSMALAIELVDRSHANRTPPCSTEPTASNTTPPTRTTQNRPPPPTTHTIPNNTPPTLNTSIFQATWQWPPTTATLHHSNRHASFIYVPILAHAMDQGHLYTSFPCKITDPSIYCNSLNSSISLYNLVDLQKQHMQQRFPNVAWSQISSGGYINQDLQERYMDDNVRLFVDCIVGEMRQHTQP